MKRILINIFLLLALSTSLYPEPPSGYCEVQVCNKLKRFTLSVSSYIKDRMGENCFNSTMPKDEAQEGKELSSESRWYQGSSINPTKRSVTYIKKIYYCSK